MRCTDRPYESGRSNRNHRSERARRLARARRRRKIMIRRMIFLFVILCFVAGGIVFLKLNNNEQTLVAEYDTSYYDRSIYEGELYSADLCVVSEDISMESGPDTSNLKAAALFDVEDNNTDFAYHVHERLYPASLTKLMTALIALEEGNLSDIVTVSADADSNRFAYDEQTCGILEGDQLTLEDLLGGLLVYSGHDNAVAIAEHIGGNTEKFAEMMNEKANEILATNSHFVNPNGLHDENHYTTAYDMYLIFNECIKYDKFVEIIQSEKYVADVVGKDGQTRQIEWEPTNYYALGDAELPESGKIIGGKTGTTLKAGNCLILLDESDSGKPYISIVMGAETKELLYQDMTDLIEGIPQNN